MNLQRFISKLDALFDAKVDPGRLLEPLLRSFIRHEEIMAGGDLRFVMQATPNKTWATSAASRPYSMSKYQ